MTNIGWALPAVWAGLALVIIGCSLGSVRSRRAYRVGIAAVSALWVGAGAAVNGYFLARGDTYSGFADGAPTSFVRDTWESVVVPNHGAFIGALIAFEAAAGALVLVEGAVRQTVLVLLIGFNLALVSFGWGFLVWSVPMVLALGLLWRAGRTRRTELPRGAVVTHSGSR